MTASITRGLLLIIGFATASALAISSNESLPVQEVRNLTQGYFLENLAVRPDGTLICDIINHPLLLLLDPATNTTQELHHFDAPVAGVTGIYPSINESDVYYVGAGNDSAPTSTANLQALYRLDLTSYPEQPAAVTKVVDMPTVGLINGVTNHPLNPSLILLTDGYAGVIWLANLTSSTYTVLANNSLTAYVGTPPSPPFLGSGISLNGIITRARSDGCTTDVYFINSDQQTCAKFAIDEAGNVVSEFEVLARGGFMPDDLVLVRPEQGGEGDEALIADHLSNGVVYAAGDGSGVKKIADTGSPTAVRWKEAGKALYVSVNYDNNTDGGVEEVDVSGAGF